MKDFLNIAKLGGNYKNVVDDIGAKRKVSCFGTLWQQRVLFLCALGKRTLFVANDLVVARRAFELFSEVLGEEAVFLPSGPDPLIFKEAQNTESLMQRIAALNDIVSGKAKVVVAPVEALLCFYPNPEMIKTLRLKIKKGEEYDPEGVAKRFVELGYKKEALVQSAGQFSLRGDCLDVFCPSTEHPFRIEFFDREVEKISFFDENTQKRLDEVDDVLIVPFTEMLLNDVGRKNLLDALEKEQLYADDFLRIIDKIAFKLEQNQLDNSLAFCYGLVNHYNIFDYFSCDDVVVIDECKAVFDSFAAAHEELKSREKKLILENMYFKNASPYYSSEKILAKINNMGNLAFLKLTTTNQFFNSDCVYSFNSAPVMRYVNNLSRFAESCQIWIDNGYKIFICAKDNEGARQIQKVLENHEIYLDINQNGCLGDDVSAIFPVEFSSGFILPNEKIVVIGTYDIFAKKTKNVSIRDNVFSVPKVGDYVVHEIHGIGLCEGVTKLTGKFGTKDYVVVRYAGEDKLYVPIDQLDMLDRFSGAETPKRLSKIGGTEFAAVKEKVRSGVRKMAFDLLSLYAEREKKTGFVFPADDMLQMEFENAFPYTETEDQLSSILEIKKDMQEGKVMDRLLCGDVGFGKTEVALRAAFKAVLASKQVAFLAPTTILSEQHYQTAKKRFDSFGVRIAVLNRFNSASEKNKILKALKAGEIDVIFGTHRLLSKDVEFADLGLIILDEEQKFGVADKEKLKLIKKDVDVLSLSATPIPRTLHMSLSGIRDISIISSPPSERLPIQTCVTENLDSIVKDAIEREIARGGQVFYVYNRVETIYKEAERLRKIVPNAKIVVGHGQLPSNELEQVVLEFTSGRADVLISTTIIENGIDISNANTLIVQNSDRFGLAQLYQIRGRVGRSNRTAYAYFLYDPQKVLTEDAYKRLDAISEFTEFGSGFKVAMRDLEIRGSGNVLGAEQHGHLQKVGYDLYCRILANEISKLKGEEEKQNREVLMRVEINAYISSDYIKDDERRMTIYKKISQIDSLDNKDKIEKEIFEIYGKLPVETKNLIEVAYIKSLARPLDIVEVVSQKDEIRFVFESNSTIQTSEKIANAVYKYRDIASLDLSKTNSIKLKAEDMSPSDRLKLAKDFLYFANN